MTARRRLFSPGVFSLGVLLDPAPLFGASDARLFGTASALVDMFPFVSVFASRTASVRAAAWGLALALGWALCAAGPAAAQSPTPATTVKNSADNTRLQLNYDGGLYVPGTYIGPNDSGTPADSIPATGAGTRMMWYPAKAAFRAGRVGLVADKSDVWDADSVGRYSVAMGLGTKAQDRGAVALGLGTTAGNGTTADGGTAATATGAFTTASGFNATATGFQTTASGKEATAMGSNTTASAGQATAMDSRTTASALQATAMGQGTTANNFRATAMGNGTTASGFNAVAMGNNTIAATPNSLTIGRNNNANQNAGGGLFVAGNGNSTDNRSDALVLGLEGDLTISGSLNENSDRRLKTAVEPLGGDILQQLRELRPVRFEFKNQKTHPSGKQLGLIAQDVRKEFPELVSKGSGGMLSLAYPKLTAVLVKGLQEQQAQIDRHQAQLNAKDRRIVELEAENEAIKERLAALEAKVSSGGPAVAGLAGPWGLGLLLGLAGLGAGLLWRRRA